MLAQQPKQRGPKIYSLHAPEVECIAKGKPHKPYEFGVKVSVATPIKPSKGGQFVSHIMALPGGFSYGDDIASIRALGLDVVSRLCEQLLAAGAPGLHFYTMNQSAATMAIWKNIEKSIT